MFVCLFVVDGLCLHRKGQAHRITACKIVLTLQESYYFWRIVTISHLPQPYYQNLRKQLSFPFVLSRLSVPSVTIWESATDTKPYFLLSIAVGKIEHLNKPVSMSRKKIGFWFGKYFKKYFKKIVCVFWKACARWKRACAKWKSGHVTRPKSNYSKI